MEGFFTIGVKEWHEACNLGLNPAASFLVLACGTERNNQTTNWSANSIEKYAGINHDRAKKAIKLLLDAGLVEIDSTSSKPRYTLQISEEVIWLPNSIVKPLAQENSPLTRVRQVQDVMLLRLYIDLYYSQNLPADGGFSRYVYYLGFDKATHASYGEYLFLAFRRGEHYVTWKTPITSVHKTEVSIEEPRVGEGPADALFLRMSTLHSLGLLEMSVCLFESSSEDAEILFPVDGPMEDETKIRRYANEVAVQVLPEWKIDSDESDYLVPVYKHQEKAQLYGIYRLRHRAQTEYTKAWLAILQKKIEYGLEHISKVERA